MHSERMLSVPEGALVESLGAGWVTFSPLSGETQVLNDEAAACLEAVMDSPRTLHDLTSAIAALTDTPQVELAVLVEDAVNLLTQAGLLRCASIA
jgi:hypothetical protein